MIELASAASNKRTQKRRSSQSSRQVRRMRSIGRAESGCGSNSTVLSRTSVRLMDGWEEGTINSKLPNRHATHGGWIGLGRWLN